MTDEELAVEEQDSQEQDSEEQELSEQEQQMAKLKEAISVDKEEVGALRLKLTITVPHATVEERMSEQFAELKREADVPGFRRGHAPMKLVEKRFASDVGEQLKSQLISSAYLAAVEKEELKPLGDPLIWTKVKGRGDTESEKLLALEAALDHFKLPRDADLTFSCEMELKPEFELPKLEKIPVEKQKIEVGDDEVDQALRYMLMSRGTFQPVDDTVQEDDMIYADVKLAVGDTVLLEEENYDLAARDIFVKGVRLEGLAGAAEGKKVGDTFSHEATVPEDHEDLELRGQTATFTCTIKEVKRLTLPELDEELLSSLGAESEKDLRDAIRGNLESRLDETVKERMREQIGDYLVDHTEMEIPEGLSQRQTERSVSRRMIEMYQAGVPQSEVEKQADEMRASAKGQAIRDLKLFFILEKIAEEREIEVSEEEINGAIAGMARRFNMRFDRMRDELSKDNRIMTLYLQMRDTKILEQLLEDAEVTETEGPKTTSAKKSSKSSGAKKTSGAKKASGAKKTPVAKKTSAKKTTKKSGGKKTTKKKSSK